jgi:hypothetical protein
LVKADHPKLAVAIVHGMGEQPADFSMQLQKLLERRLNKLFTKSKLKVPELPFIFVPVHWSRILDDSSKQLIHRLQLEKLRWRGLREYIMNYLGDAIAYQRPYLRNEFMFDLINQRLKQCLHQLAITCGDQAPLCVISHSLGTVICNELFKNIQQADGRGRKGTPLERGDTLALYFTMGSPIPIWSLREQGYGTPPSVPASSLQDYHPDIQGEWTNFYSRSDVLGFPLQPINATYKKTVTRDVIVSAGNWFIRFTPLSHIHYWSDPTVIDTIANSLYRTWEQMNTKSQHRLE